MNCLSIGNKNIIRYICPYLIGRAFYLVVDHKNLINFVKGTTNAMEQNSLLCRLRAKLAIYDYYIFWNSTVKMEFVDFLNRNGTDGDILDLKREKERLRLKKRYARKMNERKLNNMNNNNNNSKNNNNNNNNMDNSKDTELNEIKESLVSVKKIDEHNVHVS